jgi:opacity protein-like surface antigen
MKKITAILIACFTMLHFNTVKAQEFSAGASLGLFRSTDAAASGQFGFNLTGRYHISDQIRVGLNLGYYQGSTTGFLGASITTSTMPITGTFEYSFNDNDISPFVLADLGFYRSAASFMGESASSTDFGFAIGAGTNYLLTDNLTAFGNAKYHFIMPEGGMFYAYTINIGLLYNF